MKEHTEKGLFSIGFYNLENLFDTKDDPTTLDDDFTPESYKKWTPKRFEDKVRKLGKAISTIGVDRMGHPPVILGVSEVENAMVLEALTTSKFLKDKGYAYVHFNSPDERAIDTALLYRSQYFKVLNAQPHALTLYNETNERDYTRDILQVTGTLMGEQVHVLVNHWPSRRKGAAETAPARKLAAQKNNEVIQSILAEEPDARIIVMGDFNDDPFSESLQILKNDYLYNPMETLLSFDKGSLVHDNDWYLFDQLLLSPNFLKGHSNSFRFEDAHIFNPRNLQEFDEPYEGNPFRTYVGKKYLGGYSDHFPVYGIFEVEK